VEVAVFNMFCMLWEVEMGTPYQMLKKNDIFSGLGKLDLEKTLANLPADNKQMAKEAARGTDQEVEEGGDDDLPVVEELFDIAEGDEEAEEAEAQPEEPSRGGVAGEAGEEDKGKSAAAAAEEEEEFVKELKRAECIVETFRDAKASTDL
jgi:hypothetical protein